MNLVNAKLLLLMLLSIILISAAESHPENKNEAESFPSSFLGGAEDDAAMDGLTDQQRQRRHSSRRGRRLHGGGRGFHQGCQGDGYACFGRFDCCYHCNNENICTSFYD